MKGIIGMSLNDHPDKQMKIIGLTGGIGSGKSAVTSYLRRKLYTVYDADEIAREAVLPGEPALKKIAETFGKDVLTEEGLLNRQALASIVFSSDEKIKVLNSIMHKDIDDRIIKYLERHKNHIIKSRGKIKTLKTVFLAAPLLFESGLDKLCDEVWLVKADDDIRIARAAMRDGVDEESIRNRIKFQMKEDEKLTLSDVIIDNNGSEDELYNKLDELLINGV